ncbi:MAG TPA: cupin domain-containing protein [Cyclobacteriaceae bacterium]|nr:cupin domain-containing protein [Cyclobacteriaceae bacterium]
MHQLRLLTIALLIPVLSIAQGKIESKAYNWDDLKSVKDENRMRRQFVDGSTTLLDNLEIHTSTVEGGEAPHPSHAHTNQEELVIIKDGTLTATIGSESKTLGPGSVVYILPGDEHGFRNAGATPCTYYIIKLKNRTPINADRGKKSGGSFMVDWNEMKFVPHDKGGRRNVVDRPTAMFERFEMHITTLNAGLASHAPHTHMPEEIILLKSGNVEMIVGDGKYKAKDGGVVVLDSGISHNLTNVGSEQATYFAFQWN